MSSRYARCRRAVKVQARPPPLFGDEIQPGSKTQTDFGCSLLSHVRSGALPRIPSVKSLSTLSSICPSVCVVLPTSLSITPRHEWNPQTSIPRMVLSHMAGRENGCLAVVDCIASRSQPRQSREHRAGQDPLPEDRRSEDRPDRRIPSTPPTHARENPPAQAA